jgi:hypothetical protein
VADQQEYDTPDDFVIVDLVRLDWNVLISTTYKELKMMYPSFPSWTPTNYYTRDYKIWLHAIPTVDWTAFDYEYRSAPELLTSDTDEMIYRDNMKRLVILKTAFILFSKFTDQQMTARANAKEVLYSKELWKAIKRNDLWDNNQISTYKTNYNPRRRTYRNSKIIIVD